jgi:transposase
MDSSIAFYREDGRGNIYDDKGNNATAYDEVPSFRLKKLTDLKKLVKNNTYSELHSIEEVDVDMKEAAAKKERESEYNIYAEKDRLLYLYFVFQKGMKHKKAAETANVNQHTARKWKQKYQQNPEEYVPQKLTNLVSSRPVSQLDDRHKDHLTSFFDENKRATIEDAVNSLTKSFKDLHIKKTRVAEFMKDECNLSIKVISRHPTKRNSPAIIEKRAVRLKEWLEKGMVYTHNCVFLDESGFDINMTRGRAWSAIGEPVIVETPSGRAVSHTVLGAISSAGVVNVSTREPGNVKRRKVVGATKCKALGDKVSVPSGTTGSHYMHFIVDTMDIMDTFPDMQRYHIVMDNAPIHVPAMIDPLIEKHGYVPVYLPPYSPELNPIEDFWAIVKSKVKRYASKDTETLTSRIIESCEEVPLQHLQNCVQHSVNLFGKCLNKEPI